MAGLNTYAEMLYIPLTSLPGNDFLEANRLKKKVRSTEKTKQNKTNKQTNKFSVPRMTYGICHIFNKSFDSHFSIT